MPSHYPNSGISIQRKAALRRREDTEALLKQERWQGAMYMAGYVVECSLKARLMELYGVHNLHELNRLLEHRTGVPIQTATHQIELLAQYHPRLHSILDPHRTSPLSAYERTIFRDIRIVNTWKVHWRYQPETGDEITARTFTAAAFTLSQFIQTQG